MKTWPGDVEQTVICIVCQQNIPIREATVGDCQPDGNQAFACAIHLSRSERLAWFMAWAKFAAKQQAIAAAQPSSEDLSY